jgi:hypothetical protein
VEGTQGHSTKEEQAWPRDGPGLPSGKNPGRNRSMKPIAVLSQSRHLPKRPNQPAIALPRWFDLGTFRSAYCLDYGRQFNHLEIEPMLNYQRVLHQNAADVS